LRGEHNYALLGRARNAFFSRRQLQRLQTLKERFRLQDHAFAAAKWAVIHCAVPIMRELPQVVDFDFYQAHFRSPARNTVIQWAAKEVRENRNDVGLHARSDSKRGTQEQ
jgi:hypothetical protein